MENENKMVETIKAAETLESKSVQGLVEGEGNSVVESRPEEKRCPNCQALLSEELLFCPECGAALKKLCPNCKTELQEGQVFCPSCGQKSTGEIAQATSSIEQFNKNIMTKGNKSKKGKLFFIIGIAVLVIGIISYFFSQNIKVAEYKDNAKTFCSTVLSAAANLETIGNAVQSEWIDYIYDRWSIYDSVDEAVQGALAKKSSEVSRAKNDKETIDALYSKLRKPVGNSSEVEELCEAVKDFYDEYEELYYCVTSPTGNYNTFKSNFSSCDTATVNAYKELKELCDDLN